MSRCGFPRLDSKVVRPLKVRTSEVRAAPMMKKAKGSWVGLGLALGVALGAAFGNVGLGVALGAAFGAALEARNRSGDP